MTCVCVLCKVYCVALMSAKHVYLSVGGRYFITNFDYSSKVGGGLPFTRQKGSLAVVDPRIRSTWDQGA